MEESKGGTGRGSVRRGGEGWRGRKVGGIGKKGGMRKEGDDGGRDHDGGGMGKKGGQKRGRDKKGEKDYGGRDKKEGEKGGVVAGKGRVVTGKGMDGEKGRREEKGKLGRMGG